MIGHFGATASKAPPKQPKAKNKAKNTPVLPSAEVGDGKAVAAASPAEVKPEM